MYQLNCYTGMKQILLLLVFLISKSIHAQDVLFSHPFMATAYVNPSLLSNPYDKILCRTAYRLQSPKINGGHSAYYSELSYHKKEWASVFNVYGLFETNNVLTKQQYFFNYTYSFALARKIRFRPNIGIGLGQLSMNWQKLTFGDMIDSGTFSGFIYPTGNIPIGGKTNYIDFRTGFSFQWDKLVFGFAVVHLNQPNISLSKDISALPMLFSAQLSYSIYLAENKYSTKGFRLLPYVSARQQSTVGVFNYGILAGFKTIWNVGLGFQHKNAISLMLRTELRRINVGFCYSRNTNGLNEITGGSYEFSLRCSFLKAFPKGWLHHDYGWFN
jgi:type IX secretion system PorP/SprF family membrane protein